MFAGINSKNERIISNIYEKGRVFYEKNDFENAKKTYSKINEIIINQDLKNRFGYNIDQIYINLGISYLASNEIQKFCESFRKVGDETNFKVRNYLKKFCK